VLTPDDTNSCDDGEVCNGLESCENGACVSGTPLDCDDGNTCNGVETCDPTTGCQPGTPLNCNDGNPCTDDSCNPATGCVFTPDDTNTCDDGFFCNGQETCMNGQCIDGPDPCPNNVNCDEGGEICFVTIRINMLVDDEVEFSGGFETYDYQATAEIGVPDPPEPGLVFVRWTGPGVTAANQSDDPLRLPAMENKTIIANFQTSPCPTGEVCVNNACCKRPAPCGAGCCEPGAPGICFIVLGLLGLRFVGPGCRWRGRRGM
jgi:hypothetical protein